MDQRIHTNFMKVVFRGKTIEIAIQTVGPKEDGQYRRVFSRDPALIEDEQVVETRPAMTTYRHACTPLGTEFNDLFKTYEHGYAGLSPQEYIDAMGFRDP